MFTPAAQTVRSSVGAALLLLVVTACADTTTAGSADSTAPPAATAVVTTEAVASTAATTTSPATTTTPPRTIVAAGTWTGVQDASFGVVKLPSGYTGLGEMVAFDGDLVGSTLYDIGVSPVGATGLVTSYADGTFRGAMAGVGEGTLAWSEPEKDTTLPAAPGTVPMVGASGDFLGAHGTFSWTYNPDGVSGTYEVRLVWD